ncbi:MAG: alkylmercury lyase [Actinobacteria bacterium]|nr:alkylmercury lyase [Actinomycetota bacterium]
MKTEPDRLESLATAVAKATPDFDEEHQRIALELYRRLAEGSPALASEVAQGAGVAVERVEELLEAWPGVFLDEDAGVIGFWGLTINKLSPTHRLEVDGRELFAWCAWDTLFLTGILGASAPVESACPTTSETISLVVSPEGVVETSHPAAVVSFLVPDRDFDADVIQSFCHFVHFFASREAGEAWTAEHPGTFLLSLGDAFELGRLVNALNFPSELGGRR